MPGLFPPKQRVWGGGGASTARLAAARRRQPLPQALAMRRRAVHAGQVYNVALSFTGLENPDAKDDKGKVSPNGP